MCRHCRSRANQARYGGPASPEVVNGERAPERVFSQRPGHCDPYPVIQSSRRTGATLAQPLLYRAGLLPGGVQVVDVPVLILDHGSWPAVDTT